MSSPINVIYISGLIIVLVFKMVFDISNMSIWYYVISVIVVKWMMENADMVNDFIKIKNKNKKMMSWHAWED